MRAKSISMWIVPLMLIITLPARSQNPNLPADKVDVCTNYLIKNFPGKPTPPGAHRCMPHWEDDWVDGHAILL